MGAYAAANAQDEQKFGRQEHKFGRQVSRENGRIRQAQRLR
jgi:hypothetical protein